jgi:hypothetical protein
MAAHPEDQSEDESGDPEEPKRPITIPCKWCPVNIQLNGTTWIHVDGGPCQSHKTKTSKTNA